MGLTICENPLITRVIAAGGGTRYKTPRLYEKPLD
jgi:hypothetical protein